MAKKTKMNLTDPVELSMATNPLLGKGSSSKKSVKKSKSKKTSKKK